MKTDIRFFLIFLNIFLLGNPSISSSQADKQRDNFFLNILDSIDASGAKEILNSETVPLIKNTKSKPATNFEEASQAVWMVIDEVTNGGTAFFISPDTVVTNLHVASRLMNVPTLHNKIQNLINNPKEVPLSKDSVKKPMYIFLYQRQSPTVFAVDDILSWDKKHDLALLTVKPVRMPVSIMTIMTILLEGSNPDFFENPYYSQNLNTRSQAPYYLNISDKARSSRKNLFSIGYPSFKFDTIEGERVFNILRFNNLFIGPRLFGGGASGSPIINEKFEVIGVINKTYSLRASENILANIFQPSKHLIKLIDKTMKNEACRKHFLP